MSGKVQIGRGEIGKLPPKVLEAIRWRQQKGSVGPNEARSIAESEGIQLSRRAAKDLLKPSRSRKKQRKELCVKRDRRFMVRG